MTHWFHELPGSANSCWTFFVIWSYLLCFFTYSTRLEWCFNGGSYRKTSCTTHAWCYNGLLQPVEEGISGICPIDWFGAMFSSSSEGFFASLSLDFKDICFHHFSIVDDSEHTVPEVLAQLAAFIRLRHNITIDRLFWTAHTKGRWELRCLCVWPQNFACCCWSLHTL